VAVTRAHPDARIVAVTPDELSVTRHLAAVEDRRCGAIATFVGRIRDHDPGVAGEVSGIEYSAHPDAETVLAGIVESLLGRDGDGWDGGAGGPVIVAVSHRTGSLSVGDVALVACVATAHRALAYEVSRELVERIKAELPVWKKQHAVDGTHHWVGL